MLGPGWRYREQGQGHLAPSVGAVVREVWQMKSIVSWTRTLPLGHAQEAVTEWAWTQSKYLSENNTVLFDVRRWRSELGGHATQLGLTLKHLF